MKQILFFGDSLTAGYGLRAPNDESFPALIGARIKNENLPYQIINAGVSGDTSAGGLQRIDYWLSRTIDVFILELGINDVLRGIQPSVTERNLDNIIKRVSSKYPQCRLALMGMELPEFVPGPFAKEFRSLFRHLADRHTMAFVPFFLEGVAGVHHLNLNDGLHPSAKGYQHIADRVWPVLKTLLEK